MSQPRYFGFDDLENGQSIVMTLNGVQCRLVRADVNGVEVIEFQVAVTDHVVTHHHPHIAGIAFCPKLAADLKWVDVVRRCTSTKSEDGGSASPHVPCDGAILADGRMVGGCGEPCNFVMDRGVDNAPRNYQKVK